MATVPVSARPPAVLEDIDWATYSRLVHIFQEQRGHRLTYDRGTLEIMSPLWEHERPARMLGRFVDVLTEELDLPCVLGGSLTLRGRGLRKGLEPDDCFWIANAPRVEAKKRLDLRRDPPPDLAIEVDDTRSSLNRLGIYAALKVPEVWRGDANGLTFHVRHGKTYRVHTHSLAFPKLAVNDLTPFVLQIGRINDNALRRQFRAWVRQELLNRPTPPAAG